MIPISATNDAYDRYRKLGIYGTGFFYTVIGMAQVFFTLYAQETGAATAMIGLIEPAEQSKGAVGR